MQTLILGFIFVLFLKDIHGFTMEHDWDGLIFTQAWPITSCIDHLDKKPHTSCRLYPNMTSWTIHGIWPTKRGTKGPNFCDDSWKFNETKIKSIEPYLIKYWTNVFADTPMLSLWKHEWAKHGTCATEISPLNSELKYFLKGIEWAQKYDIVGMLGTKHIYPDDVVPYQAEALSDAISSFTGSDVIVDCIYNKEKNVHELSQVKLCFNRMLHLIDCSKLQESMASTHGNCPSDVIYPSSVKSYHITYYYPQDLAKKHSQFWLKSLGVCQSWLCDVFAALEFLSVI